MAGLRGGRAAEDEVIEARADDRTDGRAEGGVGPVHASPKEWEREGRRVGATNSGGRGGWRAQWVIAAWQMVRFSSKHAIMWAVTPAIALKKKTKGWNREIYDYLMNGIVQEAGGEQTGGTPLPHSLEFR